MQIGLTFTCRECGNDQELLTDTCNYGVLCLAGMERPFPQVQMAEVICLKCQACSHVSGVLGLGYHFDRERHAPSRERERR